MSDDTKIILGMPVSHTSALKEYGWVPYKNSVVVDCADCGNPCYIGPEQNAKRKSDGMAVWCAICIAKLANAHGATADDINFITLSDKEIGE